MMNVILMVIQLIINLLIMVKMHLINIIMVRLYRIKKELKLKVNQLIIIINQQINELLI